jgi:hypothetical protein
MDKYRFFISYARKDYQSVEILVYQLESLGHNVWWDKRLEAGGRFSDEIKETIKRCHFFLAILTENSTTSPWVQQEIGYALACNVPVVPVAFGAFPDLQGMIGEIQGIIVPTPLDVTKLRMKLKQEKWGKILLAAQQKPIAVFQCNSDAGEKSKLISLSAQKIASDFKNANILQRSTLTSFGLPAELENRNWEAVGDKKKLFWFDTTERQALETLAKGGGCYLIIDPCYSQAGYRIDIHRAKLLTLRDFLGVNVDIQVVISNFLNSESEIIIDDHWAAHSAAVATMATDRETISTWHAPTVRRYAEIFHREFDSLFEQQAKSRGPQKSTEYAIDRINCRLNLLKNHSAVPDRCETCKFQHYIRTDLR